MFSTEVRFSGMAIGTQLGFLMAGFAPSIVTALGGVRERAAGPSSPGSPRWSA